MKQRGKRERDRDRETTHRDLERERSMAPHALVLPYLAQGHIIPLMELSHRLVDNGFRVTFVVNEFYRTAIVASLAGADELRGIKLVSSPDGLTRDEDRKDLGKLTDGFMRAMPAFLEELILSNNGGGDEFTCMIADGNMSWALPAAKAMGLKVAALWPASTALLALFHNIPNLIRDGILDEEGLPTKQESFRLSPEMPSMDPSHLSWNFIGGDSESRRLIFEFILNNNRATEEAAEFLLCNSSIELEAPSFAVAPKLLPVGPLLAGRKQGRSAGQIWPEDDTCVRWLDDQPANSVVYVAFGSLAVFDRLQFQELAMGLELSGRPFLWVVRPDLTAGDCDDDYPEGFHRRMIAGGRGKVVDWAPQLKVLSHPSVACFVSHCGWNSTMEGVAAGMPFLCWPYFVDQFLNQAYICEVWKTGLGVLPDKASGIVTREHIRERLTELLDGGGEMKERALELKEAVGRSEMEGSESLRNLGVFIDAMKK